MGLAQSGCFHADISWSVAPGAQSQGIVAPTLVLDPALSPSNPDAFGPQSNAVVHVYTFRNVGSTPTSALSTSLKGPNPGAWSIVLDQCSGQSLAGGASCAVQLEFMALTQLPGSFAASLVVSAASGGVVTEGVSGIVKCLATTQSFSTPSAAPVNMVIPSNCTSATVKAWGAGGGSSTFNSTGKGGPGGGGSFAMATLHLAPGQALSVYVGGGGADSTAGGAGGVNGGGAGGAGGGGWSGVVGPSGSIVIAAGGGGAGFGGWALSGAPGGGDQAGGAGASADANPLGGGGGGAGTATGGGTPGTPGGGSFTLGTAGSPGQSLLGGAGGIAASNASRTAGRGGGGGGGYFGGGGGGGGGVDPTPAAGAGGSGGGGSSFIDPAWVTASTGLSGNGQVPGGAADPSYLAGVAAGGVNNPDNPGGNGYVLITTP